MSRVLVFALTVLFLANTTIVSAWGQPCVHDTNASASTGETASQDAAQPCHQTEDTGQPDGQSCEGLCLCAHASGTPSLFMKNNDGMRLPVAIKQLFAVDNDVLASISLIPPKRPPKHIS